MPPSRRQPRSSSARRPRVAGLRKPTSSPSPRPRPEEQEHDSPAEAATEAPAESTHEAASESDAEVDARTGAPTSDEAEQAAAPPTPPDDDAATASTATDAPAAVGTRPSPRPKTRDAGIQKPDGSTPAEPQRSAAEEGSRADHQASAERTRATDAATSPERKRYLLAAVFTVVAVLLIGLAVFFKVQGGQASSVTSNSALIDPARTAEVKQAATGAVESLFSYDFNNIAKTEDAAKNLLATDQVREQYNKEFAEVKRLAPDQKMVVTSKVTRSGVIMIDGDRAKVLTFIDQTSTRTDQNKTSAGGSQLAVTMHKQDGSWKVTGLDAYSAGQQGGSGQPPAGQAPPG